MPQDSLLPPLAAALRRLRLSRQLTLKDVALGMGKNPSAETQISRWERGATSIAATDLLRCLKAIGVTLADLDSELNPHQITNLRLRQIAEQLDALTPPRALDADPRPGP